MEDHSRRRYIYVDQLCTCLDLDLGAGAAGVGGGDGLVGGVDPHPAHAAGEELVALAQRHVVGLLHLELRLGQLHRRETSGGGRRKIKVWRSRSLSEGERKSLFI